MTILESDDFIPVNTSGGDIELMLILGEQHGSIMLNISQPNFFWGGIAFRFKWPNVQVSGHPDSLSQINDDNIELGETLQSCWFKKRINSK